MPTDPMIAAVVAYQDDMKALLELRDEGAVDAR